jgi:hypothetical protein
MNTVPSGIPNLTGGAGGDSRQMIDTRVVNVSGLSGGSVTQTLQGLLDFMNQPAANGGPPLEYRRDFFDPLRYRDAGEYVPQTVSSPTAGFSFGGGSSSTLLIVGAVALAVFLLR